MYKGVALTHKCVSIFLSLAQLFLLFQPTSIVPSRGKTAPFYLTLSAIKMEDQLEGLHVIIGVTRRAHDASFYFASTYYVRSKAGLCHLLDSATFRVYSFPKLTVSHRRFLAILAARRDVAGSNTFTFPRSKLETTPFRKPLVQRIDIVDSRQQEPRAFPPLGTSHTKLCQRSGQTFTSHAEHQERRWSGE